MVLGPYRRVFSEIHVFSPSWGLDNIWDEVEKHAKSLDGPEHKSTFHDSFDEKALHEILQTQRARLTRLKQQKTREPLPQILCIFDDLADTGHMHQAHNLVMTLFVRGRHLGVSTWLSVQKLSTIHPTARTNFAFILCWALRNKKELWDGLIYELSNVAPTETLLAMYELATEERYSFWYVNLRKLPAEFFVRFDEKLEFSQRQTEEPEDSEPPAKRHQHGDPHQT